MGPGGRNANRLWWRDTGRRRGPHSQDIQDTFNRANSQINGSTSSDAQFTWSLAQGAANRWNIVSNEAVSSRTGSDIFTVGLPSVAMDTVDHYGQWDLVGLNFATGSYLSCEIALRIRYGTGAAGDEGYAFACTRGSASSSVGSRLVYDWSDGTPLDSDSTLVTSGLIYFEANGSTGVAKIAGVTIFTVSLTFNTYTSVCPCTYVSGNNSATVVADNFRAADLGGAGTPGAVFSYHYQMQGIA